MDYFIISWFHLKFCLLLITWLMSYCIHLILNTLFYTLFHTYDFKLCFTNCEPKNQCVRCVRAIPHLQFFFCLQTGSVPFCIFWRRIKPPHSHTFELSWSHPRTSLRHRYSRDLATSFQFQLQKIKKRPRLKTCCLTDKCIYFCHL